MKKLTTIITSLIFAAFMFSSCSTTTPLTATNNPTGDKKGTSSNTCIFGGYYPYDMPGQGRMTSNGLCLNTEEYGIMDAAQKANIKEVSTVDLKVTNFILWKEFELVVTGN